MNGPSVGVGVTKEMEEDRERAAETTHKLGADPADRGPQGTGSTPRAGGMARRFLRSQGHHRNPLLASAAQGPGVSRGPPSPREPGKQPPQPPLTAGGPRSWARPQAADITPREATSIREARRHSQSSGTAPKWLPGSQHGAGTLAQWRLAPSLSAAVAGGGGWGPGECKGMPGEGEGLRLGPALSDRQHPCLCVWSSFRIRCS